ncbi:MAG: CotH kinase family protein [Bacteroidaceae bacterium]|nr:CotH kinase family protein [Bacteroidaceae bacterium]
MRKLLLLCAALLCSMTTMGVTFDPNKKYAIMCQEFGQGGIGLGAYHEVSPILYYVLSKELPEDAYWYIRQDEAGNFTFQNALSKQYIVYDSERVDAQKKGLNVAAAADDVAAQWSIMSLEDGGFFVRSIAAETQYFNVRKDGTYLVGTYADYRSNNGRFYFYDEDGNLVTEEGGDVGEVPGVNLDNNVGMTDEGLYWECTGKLSVPVVTSTMADPVLYKIRNNRSGKYLAYEYGALSQTEQGGSDFFVVEKNGGYQFVTQDGYAVSTYYPDYAYEVFFDRYVSGANMNKWGFEFYSHGSNPGYAVSKLTDLPEFQNGEVVNGQSPNTYWNDFSGSYIGLWSFDAGGTFTFCSADERHVEYLRSAGINVEGLAPVLGFRAMVDTLRLNDKELIYDEGDDCYVVALPRAVRESGTFEMSVNFDVKVDDGSVYELRLDNVAPNADGNIVIEDFDALEPHYFSIYKDGEECQTADVRFTYLNLVEVNYPSCNSSYYVTGSLRVTQPNLLGYDSLYVAAFKYRGASAQNYPKKSYAIKMKEADGVTSRDVEFLGLRDDNNWILDAMAVDRACMRNRVSTDLWNDFATAPYYKRDGREPKARHGTRGEFAEVYLNGKYHGIYCLTEKMDRKQLKLKKLEQPTGGKAIMHGTLYKSSQWSYEVFMGHEQGQKYFPMTSPQSYDNNLKRETWANYEIKYPDYEEEPIDWAPLWNAIDVVASYEDSQFSGYVTEFFDMKNVVDYYLFIELMLATDNHGKNMFFYNYDQQATTSRRKIGLAPWDLDGTWGRRWDGSSSICRPNQDFTTFLWAYEHGTLTLFHRLQEIEYMNWEEQLAKRYAELRETYFTEESLHNRFETYATLFEASGADAREAECWDKLNHSNIRGDVDYIKNWITARLAFLDEQYGYVAPSSIDVVKTDYVGVTGGEGCLYIKSNIQQEVSVYNLSGVLVRRISVQPGIQRIDGLAKGVYVVAGTKVIVK